MRAALALVLLLAVCAPTVSPAPAASEPAPIVRPLSLFDSLPSEEPVLGPAAGFAGADALEGEGASLNAGSAPINEPSDEPAAADPPRATAVPTWLRAVREPPPVTFIGSGRASPKRVGLQVGHWGNESLPLELEHLRESGGGAVGGGYTEVQINYDLAQRTAKLLRVRGVEVDILPATIPVDYQADAFVAIHADGDVRGVLNGYKLARSPLSQIPAWDDALVGWLYAEYGRVTGLPRDDDHITQRMKYYYAFNNRRYYYAVAPSTPAAIIETGFVTSPTDRALLAGEPDRAAAGLAAGLLGFLGIAR